MFTNPMFGFDAGLRLDAGSDSLILSAEAMYRLTGSFFSVKRDLTSKDEIRSGQLILSYLYFPIVLRLKNKSGFFIETGGYY